MNIHYEEVVVISLIALFFLLIILKELWKAGEDYDKLQKLNGEIDLLIEELEQDKGETL